VKASALDGVLGAGDHEEVSLRFHGHLGGVVLHHLALGALDEHLAFLDGDLDSLRNPDR